MEGLAGKWMAMKMKMMTRLRTRAAIPASRPIYLNRFQILNETMNQSGRVFTSVKSFLQPIVVGAQRTFAVRLFVDYCHRNGIETSRDHLYFTTLLSGSSGG